MLSRWCVLVMLGLFPAISSAQDTRLRRATRVQTSRALDGFQANMDSIALMPPVLNAEALSTLLTRLTAGDKGEFESSETFRRRTSAKLSRWVNDSVLFAFPLVLGGKYPCESKLFYDADKGEYKVSFGLFILGGLPLSCHFVPLENVVVSNAFGARNVMKVFRVTEWALCRPNQEVMSSPEFAFPLDDFREAPKLAHRVAVAILVGPIQDSLGNIITTDTTKAQASLETDEAQLLIKHCVNTDHAVAVLYDVNTRRIVSRYPYAP